MNDRMNEIKTADNKPVITNRDRGLSISVFTHDFTRDDGKTVKTYSCCLQRSYQLKDSDDWKREQVNLRPEEMLKLANLCARTYSSIVDYVNALKAQTSSSDGAVSYPSSTMDDSVPF